MKRKQFTEEQRRERKLWLSSASKLNAPGDYNWLLSRDDCIEVVKKASRSTPVLDGIPLEADKAVPKLMGQALHDLIHDMSNRDTAALEGSPLGIDINEAWLVLLGKKQVDGNPQQRFLLCAQGHLAAPDRKLI